MGNAGIWLLFLVIIWVLKLYATLVTYNGYAPKAPITTAVGSCDRGSQAGDIPFLTDEETLKQVLIQSPEHGERQHGKSDDLLL